MKITKSQLKKLIKEELGMMSEQEMDLEGRTFNFQIFHTERDIGLRAYLVNVPSSMLDPRSIERMKDHEAERGPARDRKDSLSLAQRPWRCGPNMMLECIVHITWKAIHHHRQSRRLLLTHKASF